MSETFAMKVADWFCMNVIPWVLLLLLVVAVGAVVLYVFASVMELRETWLAQQTREGSEL